MKGFWLKDHNIYDLPASHVRFIIKNSKMFNMEVDEIRDIYRKHNEPVYSEGKARGEIINKVLVYGWVHIRQRKNYWNINCNKFNESLDSIKNFLEYGIQNKILHREDSLRIYSSDRNGLEIGVGEILGGGVKNEKI